MENLLNRLTLARKLLLLCILAVAFVAYPTQQFLRVSSAEVEAAQSKASGIAPIRSLLRVMQLAQQHRGMSSAVLGGNASFADARAAKQTELDQAVAKMSSVIEGNLKIPALTAAWAPAAKEWADLARSVSVKSLSSKDSFARHTAMISVFIGALDQLIDHVGLAADTDVASAQMVGAVAVHLPNLTEMLGQARARGTNHLGQKSITPQDRIALASLLDMAALHHGNMARAMGKAMKADTRLEQSLSGMAKEGSEQTARVLKLAREQLVQAETLSYPPADFFGATTQAIDTQFKLNDKAFDQLEQLLDQRSRSAQRSFWTLLGTFALVLLLIAFLGVRIVRSVTRRLAEAVEVADAMAIGDLSRQIEVTGTDETGKLLASLKTTQASVQALVTDAVLLSNAAVEGKLETRADAARHQGDFRKVVEGVNKTLDAVVVPLTVAASYVDQISKGAIPAKITDSYSGDFNTLKNNLNMAIDAINALVADANALAKAAVEGKLETRADAARHQGDFRKIVEGVNNTLDAVIGPLNVAASYVDQISKGAIPKKITDSYNGDFNTLKNNLNMCIDAVNALVADAAMLAKAAVDGKLSTRADASKHQGDFQAIVKGCLLYTSPSPRD